MKHIYNPTKAAYTQRPSAKATGTAAASKILSLLLLSFFLLVSGESVGQTITSLNTNCALEGQDVTLTISGSNFRSNNSDGASRVIINDNNTLVPTSITPTSIVVFVPKSLINGSTFQVKVSQKGKGQTVDVTPNSTANLISIATSPGQVCSSPGQVTITASASGAPSGFSYRWYNSNLVQIGGTGNSYTTTINSTTTFYVSVVTGSCETSPVPVVATVGGITPVVTGDQLCNAGNVKLTASGAPANGIYRWYTSTNPSATPVYTGPEYTPFVNATSTYYVQIENTACANPRVAVVATIGSINAPTVSATVNCDATGAQVITFYAGGARNVGDEYIWYDNTNTEIGTGSSVTRSTNQNSGLHYVVIRSSTCTSARTYLEVPANNSLRPTTPTNITAERCVGGAITINATPVLGMVYKWYSPTGLELSEGNSFTIEAVNAGTTTYYYRRVNYATGCISDPATVTITGSSPVAATGDIVRPIDPVVGQPATFSFTSNIQSSEVESYQWYYRTVGSGANDWSFAANTKDWTISSMRGDIDAVKVVLTLKSQNAICYNNLNIDGRTYEINDLSITPLPVELMFFKAQAQTKGVNLTWATASELENKGFEVQVSNNGRDFAAIGFVESRVNTTSSRQEYNFLDTKAVSGTLYYRLKQVDLDGTTSFSPIRAVALNSDNVTVTAYPNPFDDAVVVTLNGTEARNVQVVLMDAMGKVLQQRTEETSGNSITVDMRNITTKGMYVLQVLDSDTKHTFKLMKR